MTQRNFHKAPIHQTIDIEKTFGFKSDLEISSFFTPQDGVPTIDPHYVFHEDVTKHILLALKHNLRLLLTGQHGTGKSTHIEQVAARLNWPCLRINLDSQLTRIDLVGRDIITIEEGCQVTRFQEGLLPWAIQRPCLLVLDEYDAARPDIMFVIQRLLESEGVLTLPEQSKVIKAHKDFRLFATANTVGWGDHTGMYQGTQIMNQGQMDRWSLVVKLDRLSPENELKVLISKLPSYDNPKGQETLRKVIKLANLIRDSYEMNEINITMSPRASLNWAQNALYYDDICQSFQLSFLNRCGEEDKETIQEFFQRCFATDIS